MSEQPYILKTITRTVRLYNPKFGDNRKCICGHAYERHFDGYEDEDEADVGCKYCACCNFVERSENHPGAEYDRLAAEWKRTGEEFLLKQLEVLVVNTNPEDFDFDSYNCPAHVWAVKSEDNLSWDIVHNGKTYHTFDAI